MRISHSAFAKVSPLNRCIFRATLCFEWDQPRLDLTTLGSSTRHHHGTPMYRLNKYRSKHMVALCPSCPASCPPSCPPSASSHLERHLQAAAPHAERHSVHVHVRACRLLLLLLDAVAHGKPLHRLCFAYALQPCDVPRVTMHGTARPPDSIRARWRRENRLFASELRRVFVPEQRYANVYVVTPPCLPLPEKGGGAVKKIELLQYKIIYTTLDSTSIKLLRHFFLAGRLHP